MSEARAVRGIVFTHGAMARGMVDAVRRIAGATADALLPLSNEGVGPDALGRELDTLAGSGPVIIFTDLQAGSCTLAAQVCSRGRGQRAVICGVNLPMLVDFVFHQEMPLEDLVPRLVEKGRTAIRSLTMQRTGEGKGDG